MYLQHLKLGEVESWALSLRLRHILRELWWKAACSSCVHVKSKLCSNSLLSFAEKLCLSFLKCLQDLTGKSFWIANPSFRFLVKLSLATPVSGFVTCFAQLDRCSLKETAVLAEGSGRPVHARPGRGAWAPHRPAELRPGAAGASGPLQLGSRWFSLVCFARSCWFSPRPSLTRCLGCHWGCPDPRRRSGVWGVRTGRARAQPGSSSSRRSGTVVGFQSKEPLCFYICSCSCNENNIGLCLTICSLKNNVKKLFLVKMKKCIQRSSMWEMQL